MRRIGASAGGAAKEERRTPGFRLEQPARRRPALLRRPVSDRLARPPVPVRRGLRHRRGKGVISAVEFGADGPLGAPQPVLETAGHLSYPYVFERDGAIG